MGHPNRGVDPEHPPNVRSLHGTSANTRTLCAHIYWVCNEVSFLIPPTPLCHIYVIFNGVSLPPPGPRIPLQFITSFCDAYCCHNSSLSYHDFHSIIRLYYPIQRQVCFKPGNFTSRRMTLLCEQLNAPLPPMLNCTWSDLWADRALVTGVEILRWQVSNVQHTEHD